MNYHNIVHDDMRNGDGLRVTLFVSGCNHHCYNCQNPQTWDCNSGIEFDLAAKDEILEQLNKDYINGITFSGGDPLHKNNLNEVLELCKYIRKNYSTKTIWLYTGYTVNIFELHNSDHTEISVNPMSDDMDCNFKRMDIIRNCDVVVDGRFIKELADVNYHWAGSTNQRVIDIKKSLEKGDVVLWNTF